MTDPKHVERFVRQAEQYAKAHGLTTRTALTNIETLTLLQCPNSPRAAFLAECVAYESSDQSVEPISQSISW